MRVISGKIVRQIDAAEVTRWAASYQNTTLDLGAGDGRFVRDLSSRAPHVAAIGIDLSAANLKTVSRKARDNALYVIADALALPGELRDVASLVTVNFPWGSLLRGLLEGHAGLLTGLATATRPGARLRIAVNAGALAEAGWALGSGGKQLTSVLHDAGFRGIVTASLGPAELRCWPTTWAKRLAFGREPRALRIDARIPRPLDSDPLGISPELVVVGERASATPHVSARHPGRSQPHLTGAPTRVR